MKVARAQIVNSRLFLKLWAESISTLVYPKIWSPSLEVQDENYYLFLSLA